MKLTTTTTLKVKDNMRMSFLERLVGTLDTPSRSCIPCCHSTVLEIEFISWLPDWYRIVPKEDKQG